MQDKRTPVRPEVAARIAARVEAQRQLTREEPAVSEPDGASERGRRVVTGVERTRVPQNATASASAAQPRVGSAEGAAPERRGKPRYRRVVIDDGSSGGDVPKPPELLASEYPARRPNRRHSPRMSPHVRPARRTP